MAKEQFYREITADKKWTFTTLKGKTCTQSFDKVGFDDPLEGDFASVKIGDKWTFFNPSTEKLCGEMFDKVPYGVHRGFNWVKKGDKYTFFDPSTDKLCKQSFDYIDGVDQGVVYLPKKLGFVAVRNGEHWTFFSPTEDLVLSAISLSEKYSYLTDYLHDHPEEFEKLPTAFFKNKENAQVCLDAIADGIKESKMEPSKVLEICDMISNKIEKEKKNIELDNQTEAEKAEMKNKVANDIKNLGRNL